MPHAVVRVLEQDRVRFERERTLDLSRASIPIIRRCQGFRVIFYQSGRQIERAKVPVGYFATAIIEGLSIHPDDPGLVTISFGPLFHIRSPKRITAKGVFEETGLRSVTNAFKGWTAAQEVREVSVADFARLTEEDEGDDYPQTFLRDELVLPRFTWHSRRIRDPKFHDRVYRAYQGRCAISGVTLVANGTCGLVAAHIFPHADAVYNFVGAGILTAPTWHDRFDLGMILIHDDRSWTAVEEDIDTRAMRDRRLLLPLAKSDWPNVDLLRQKRAIHGYP